ncbi:hypothetical protein D3C85_1920790 [compost metagenome]
MILLSQTVHDRSQLLGGLVQNFFKQLFLGFEKSINRAFAYIRDLGHLIHSRGFIAKLYKGLGRRLQN